MKQLQIKADRFRKQGQLQDQDLHKIIKEIKEGSTAREQGESDSADQVVKDKHRQVSKAVEEGLLQTHRTAPNMKQQGIF